MLRRSLPHVVLLGAVAGGFHAARAQTVLLDATFDDGTIDPAVWSVVVPEPGLDVVEAGGWQNTRRATSHETCHRHRRAG